MMRMITAPGPLRWWTSVAGLLVMTATFGLAAYWILSALLNPGAAGCHNAPLRDSSLPQLIGVLASSVGFIAGRISARPRVSERSQLSSRVTGADDRDRAHFSVVTHGALTSALLFIAVLMAFEAITLATSVWPITYYLRCANEAATVRTLVGAFAFCFLAGRWLWLPAPPPEGR